jgi:PPM family protein phosphatase
MGGHTAGGMASSMAVQIVTDFIKESLSDSEITWPFGLDYSLSREINAISSGIRLANRHIFNDLKNMGTTMVVLLIKDNTASICHVGDSRLYRIRDNTIEQITEDHSLLADEIKKGTITKEQAVNYPLRHVITRAIGISADIQCDYFAVMAFQVCLKTLRS